MVTAILTKGDIKISDLGFAKMISDEESKNSPPERARIWVPVHMSPQILLGEPYTIKCDVWSCGIVFYKILFNSLPWGRTEHLNLFVLMERMQC